MPIITRLMDDFGASVRRWIATGAASRALSNAADDASDLAVRALRVATMPDPIGRHPFNFWTGIKARPSVSAAVMAGGVGIGLARGALTIEQAHAAGIPFQLPVSPDLTYDYSVSPRSTPFKAEDLGASGDLVFALKNAYLR